MNGEAALSQHARVCQAAALLQSTHLELGEKPGVFHRVFAAEIAQVEGAFAFPYLNIPQCMAVFGLRWKGFPMSMSSMLNVVNAALDVLSIIHGCVWERTTS